VKVEEAPAVLDDAAESFISVETERIQKVLAASSALNDVNVLEACSKRLQLLSNLRALIEGSGAKSRLANAARAAREESDRLALVAKLFGSDMPAHWAPKDARDVVVELVPEPEKVLRDPRASAQDKRHALYAFLATSTPTDEQQMWLGNVAESLIQ
jgi:predicted type IV restriction endonuclease